MKKTDRKMKGFENPRIRQSRHGHNCNSGMIILQIMLHNRFCTILAFFMQMQFTYNYMVYCLMAVGHIVKTSVYAPSVRA